MSDREKTCAERIGDHLAGRLDDLRSLNDGVPLNHDENLTDDEDRREAATEELFDYPLSVSVERVVRVDLSTGGPADWLELFYRSDESRPHRIVYHFADWFDHAERALEGDEFDDVETAFGDLIDAWQS